MCAAAYGEGFVENSCFDAVLYGGKVCVVCVATLLAIKTRRLQVNKDTRQNRRAIIAAGADRGAGIVPQPA